MDTDSSPLLCFQNLKRGVAIARAHRFFSILVNKPEKTRNLSLFTPLELSQLQTELGMWGDGQLVLIFRHVLSFTDSI